MNLRTKIRAIKYILCITVNTYALNTYALINTHHEPATIKICTFTGHTVLVKIAIIHCNCTRVYLPPQPKLNDYLYEYTVLVSILFFFDHKLSTCFPWFKSSHFDDSVKPSNCWVFPSSIYPSFRFQQPLDIWWYIFHVGNIPDSRWHEINARLILKYVRRSLIRYTNYSR